MLYQTGQAWFTIYHVSDSDPYRAHLEQVKRASVAQLLFKCARLLNEQALARLRERGGAPKLRPAHAALFPHIDLDGTRLTELARRVGVSKQAVNQLVNDLEEMGTVERTRDPTDGRAKLIRFSRHGRNSILDGLAMLGEIETELAQKIGEDNMSALHRALIELEQVLEHEGI